MIGRALFAGAALVSAAQPASAQSWMQFAGGEARVSLAPGDAPWIGSARWHLGQTQAGTVSFIGQASFVSDGLRVYGVGRIGTQHWCCAIDRASGGLAWAAPVPSPYLDSWSTPAVDLRSGVVLVATGRFITALDLGTGAQRWQTQLARNIVNASPLVVDALGRAFVTDYDGFGNAGSLTCLNLRAASPPNPWQPGEIVWSVVLGSTAGNTPAYADGRVFVSAAAGPGGAGMVFAFQADAASAPVPLWATTNPAGHGFYGGVAVSGGGVFAASYALYGGQFAANLLKLDSASGQVRWSAPCNRTDAIPVPLPGDRVLVSGGVLGFGCVPSVQLFRDLGSSALLQWDSALDSWSDLNENGSLDPGEYLQVGGWTQQPAAFAGAAGLRVAVGTSAPGTPNFGASTDLRVLDLSRTPSDPAFVLQQYQGAGSSPAVADGLLLSNGPGGLHAFGEPGCAANCDGSTTPPVLNVADFTCFLGRYAAGEPRANCDGSTVAPVLNVADFTCFLARYAEGCP